MATSRLNTLNQYERQIVDSDFRKVLPTTLFVGTNAANSWTVGHANFDVQRFVAEYELPILPTVNVVGGARGESIASAAPKRCVREWDIDVVDYDQTLLDVFKGWLYAGTELRIYAWADFMVLGYIGKVPLTRPRPEKLKVQILPKAVYVVKSTLPAAGEIDFTTAHHTFDATNFIPYLEAYGT